MKRIALVAAIFAVAACSNTESTPATDTTTPAMAPAPAMTDSAMRADSMRADSLRADSAKAATKTP